MGRVIRYVSQEKKTMDETGRRYLSGVNCTPELAQKSFMATKNLYGKADGIFFYQYVQSRWDLLLPVRPVLLTQGRSHA